MMSWVWSSFDPFYACCTLLKWLGFVVPVHGAVQPREVVQARGHIGMIRAEGLLPDRQGALVERLGLRVVALGVVQQREVVQAPGHIGMIRAEGILQDRQRALIERLGLRVLTLGAVIEDGAMKRGKYGPRKAVISN